MRQPPSNWLRLAAAALCACVLLLPSTGSAVTFDYHDYRDAGYFEDGFYDDDWFYDWYDTGFYDGDDEYDYSQYYDDAGEKGLFDF